jgi:hypothetical protein
VRRGKLLGRPEKTDLVALREMLHVIESFVLDLGRDDERRASRSRRFSGVSASPVPSQLRIPFQKRATEKPAAESRRTGDQSGRVVLVLVVTGCQGVGSARP